jgi:cytochrome bd-type quinol oxidase subunit 1
VASEQPVKLAAIEGLGPTTPGVVEHLLGWYDGHKVVYGIGIPRLLALLAFHNPNATVQGLDTVPPAMLASGWWVLFLVTLPLGVVGLYPLVAQPASRASPRHGCRAANPG